VKVTSATRIPLLVSGNVDLVAASMTHTRERDRAIDFSITYYTGGQSLMVPQRARSPASKDLGGKQVAVQQEPRWEKTSPPSRRAQDHRVPRLTAAWLALAQGRADAFTRSLNCCRDLEDNPNFKIVGELFSVEPFGIGVRRAIPICATRSISLSRICDFRRIRDALSQMVQCRADGADRGLAVDRNVDGS